MNKRSLIIVITVSVIICLGIIGYVILSNIHSGFDVEIKNNTSGNLSGLNITYNGILEDIQLPQIEAGKTNKINVNPKENFGENSMIIYYKDKRGVIQENTLIGYFEKGYSGKVKVNINSQDKNGLLVMQIEERIY